MQNQFTPEEIKKARSVMMKNPNYKVENVQRAILKGYMYTARLIDYIRKNDDVFLALAYMGEASQKLSWATTFLGDVEKVPEELKQELKNIQQQLHDFKEKVRNT